MPIDPCSSPVVDLVAKILARCHKEGVYLSGCRVEIEDAEGHQGETELVVLVAVGDRPVKDVVRAVKRIGDEMGEGLAIYRNVPDRLTKED